MRGLTRVKPLYLWELKMRASSKKYFCKEENKLVLYFTESVYRAYKNKYIDGIQVLVKEKYPFA